MTVRPHYQRMNLALDKARQRALREQRAAERARRKAEPSGPVWPNEETREIRAALAAFDRAEYEQMRDWLKNHGAILWGGERPDGSLRGETYAFG
jgi:hypothetical protein